MSNQDESFFQEVDQRVRDERMLSLAKKYGPWLAGAFVAILFGVIAGELWRNYEGDEAKRQSVAFAEAQQKARTGEADAAIAQFETMSKSGPQVYRVLAMMERAAALQSKGDLQGALAGFDEAATAARDPILRDSARMRAAYIVADTQDFQAVRTRLQPIIDGGGQMSYLARELLGVEAWEAGETDLARDTLAPIALALEAPESVRQRAELVLTVLGPAPAAPATTTPAPGNAAKGGEGRN